MSLILTTTEQSNLSQDIQAYDNGPSDNPAYDDGHQS